MHGQPCTSPCSSSSHYIFIWEASAHKNHGAGRWRDAATTPNVQPYHPYLEAPCPFLLFEFVADNKLKQVPEDSSVSGRYLEDLHKIISLSPLRTPDPSPSQPDAAHDFFLTWLHQWRVHRVKGRIGLLVKHGLRCYGLPFFSHTIPFFCRLRYAIGVIPEIFFFSALPVCFTFPWQFSAVTYK